MIEITTLFAAAVLLAAALAMIGVWSPRKLWVKLVAIGVMAGFVPVAYASMDDLLSKPKPIAMESISGDGQAQVLGAQMKEGEGIYLWLQLPSVAEPRYYKLPWSEPAAKQLQEAMQQADREKTGIAMRLPVERNWDDREKLFHAMPQPKLPDKFGAPPEAPTIYRHPGQRA